MQLGEDRWVCGTCRSINTRRSDHCYNCHAPRRLVEVDPHEIPGSGHPTQAPPPPLNPYRSARRRATIAAALILSASAASFVGWVAQSQAILTAIEVQKSAPPEDLEAATAHALDAIIPVSHLQVPLTALWVVLAVGALVAWAAWLSRVVDNLPALGVGYSRVSPQIAFIENFLMGRNLYSMPARVREVTQKLHPAGGGDEILALAWLTLFGSVIGGRVAFYVARILADSEADYLRARIVVGGLTTIVAFAGYVLVVAVIRRVEVLSEERAAGVGADVGTPAATGPIRAAGSATPASTPNAMALPTAAEPTLPTAAESAPASAAIRPASSFAAGRTVESLAQRGAAASPGTATGATSSPGTASSPSAAGEPGPDDPSPDEPRRPA